MVGIFDRKLLNCKTKQILVLYYYEKQTLREIADQLGITESQPAARKIVPVGGSLIMPIQIPSQRSFPTMKTPIYDALQAYADRQPIRFHMPGHKGHSAIPESAVCPEILQKSPVLTAC